jgi:hypothetical protein
MSIYFVCVTIDHLSLASSLLLLLVLMLLLLLLFMSFVSCLITFSWVFLLDAQGGSAQYDEVLGPNSFLTVYHDVFRILFQPSPGVAKVMQQKLQLGEPSPPSQQGESLPSQQPPPPQTQSWLIPGKYSVAHYRAEYGNEVGRHPKLTQPQFLQSIALNALRCAMELQPGAPIYFASDNMIALAAVRRIAAYTHYPIWTFDRDERTVLHLDDTGVEDHHNNHTVRIHSDKSGNGRSSNSNSADHSWLSEPPPPPNRYPPSDYYSTFVDLLLAGNGDCVTFGRGGFGRFANLLSFNASCAFKHVKQFNAVPCQGHPPLDKTEEELANEGFFF